MMRLHLSVALLLGGLAIGQGAFAQERNAAEEAQRWELVRDPVFHGRTIQDAGDEVKIIVPERAMDAALVPITVQLAARNRAVAVTLFIDNNPAPVVGTFRFGPAISPEQIKLRVRVNDFTPVHAVAELEDGTLLAASQYVKAAGGCSAPSTGQSEEIAARMGQMQLRRTRPREGAAIPSQLFISHPDYNGMQSAPTGGTLPARYLETVSVKTGGVSVFELQSDISMSEDPVISFTYTPAGDGGVDVVAHDSSGADFTHHFEPLANCARHASCPFRDARGFALLVAATVPEPEGFRLDAYNAPVPETLSGARTVDAKALEAAMAEGAIAIDVMLAPRRPPSLPQDRPWLPVPRMHVPGSLWWPEVGRGAISPALDEWFRARLGAVTGGDENKPIAFYCKADCWMSWNAAKRAISYGYAMCCGCWGAEAWEAAGLELQPATPEDVPLGP